MGGILLDTITDPEEEIFSRTSNVVDSLNQKDKKQTFPIHRRNTKESAPNLTPGALTSTGSFSEEEREKKNKRRKQIIDEILSTELSYFNSLENLYTIFLQPLTTPDLKSKLVSDTSTADLISKVAADVFTIKSCHQMLLDGLKPTVQTWDDKSLIGSLFEKMVRIFRQIFHILVKLFLKMKKKK